MAGRATSRAHTLFRNLHWMDTHHFNTIPDSPTFLPVLPTFLTAFLTAGTDHFVFLAS
jgi:hypothetical protein